MFKLLLIVFLLPTIAFTQSDSTLKLTVNDYWISDILKPNEFGVTHFPCAENNNRHIFEVFYNQKDMEADNARGWKCFELTECHAWRRCDCAPIDSAYNALRYRYKTDKKFRDSVNEETREAIDKFLNKKDASKVKD